MAKIGKVIELHTATTLSTEIARNDGFWVDATGTIAVQARGDSAISAAFPVVAGVYYPIDVRYLNAASFSTTAQVWIVRAQEH